MGGIGCCQWEWGFFLWRSIRKAFKIRIWDSSGSGPLGLRRRYQSFFCSWVLVFLSSGQWIKDGREQWLTGCWWSTRWRKAPWAPRGKSALFGHSWCWPWWGGYPRIISRMRICHANSWFTHFCIFHFIWGGIFIDRIRHDESSERIQRSETGWRIMKMRRIEWRTISATSSTEWKEQPLYRKQRIWSKHG